MSPDQISIVVSFLSFIERISRWPFGLMLFLFIIGPWLLALILSYLQKKRFDSVVRMYESNVSLVEDYHSVASDLKDVVILNTQTITTLNDEIRQNEFCPMQRVNKKKVIKGVG